MDRLKNRVMANFGIYTAISDTTGDSEPTTKTKYGDLLYTVTSSALLPEENVNLAYAIAPTIAAYSKVLRRRCQAVCKSLPYLELGDNVYLTYEEPTALKSWTWGDGSVSWGDPTIEFYTDAIKTQRISFNHTTMRIEGMEFDWWGGNPDTGWQMILDLVENP